MAVDDPLYEEEEQAEGDESVEQIPHEDDVEAVKGKWTLGRDATQRPGPHPLIGRRQKNDSKDSSPSTTSAGSFSDSLNRIPAAGAGTRTGPRPVPRSSSSLRHISSKARTSSFGVGVPEDRDVWTADRNGDFRSVQSSLNAAKRRLSEEQADLLEDSDEDRSPITSEFLGEATGWEADFYGSLEKRQAHSSVSSGGNQSTDDLVTYASSSDSGEEVVPVPTIVEADEQGQQATQEQDESEQRRRIRYAAAEPGGPSLAGPSQAPWHPQNRSRHDRDSPPLLGSSSGLMTPGPIFPQSLHTPQNTEEDPIHAAIEPRQRLEWHTMLQSVLRSEVLQSETKRITSADAPSLTKRELMYQRWLDIRASLRGRGHHPGAIEAEEKRLRDGWPVLLREVMEAVRQCRTEAKAIPSTVEIDDASLAIEDISGAKEAVFAEVDAVLKKVDDAEEQFPSLRKMIEEIPEWNEEGLQKKLNALYSWYNVMTNLRRKLRILQVWTGSKKLEITGHPSLPRKEVDEASPLHDAHLTGLEAHEGKGGVIQAELEGSTFLERILKEDSLQSAFETRTLRALNQLTIKAKEAVIEHHEAFSQMSLPSFEPELSQLINFPTRLMEGALKLRLEYAGKLKEPSLLIVDSLVDDMRAAIALACRIKMQYRHVMVPDPAHGWDLQPCLGQGYDPVLREALRFFFKLLDYKLKGGVSFKETELLEPEWRFLSTAVEVIEGGDIIVAICITRFVNKLFKRIVRFFQRELSKPSTRRRAAEGLVEPMAGVGGPNKGGLVTAASLSKGSGKMTLDEKVRWIQAVFNSVRIRSRKLLNFARGIRSRLENAAEYDLSSLTPSTNTDAEEQQSEPSSSDISQKMDLTEFLQTLIDAGFFLVLTGAFESEGIYLIAEPSLSDKPELIQEIFCKCVRRVKPQEESTFAAANDNAHTALDLEIQDEESEQGEDEFATGEDNPRYLLMLSPRDAFLWTGRVMSLNLPRIDVDLKERRLRLIAEGSARTLQKSQKHLYSIFNAVGARSSSEEDGGTDAATVGLSGTKRQAGAVAQEAEQVMFPLEVVADRLAHISAVQAELRRINHGVYTLSDTIIRAVPTLRRNLRGRRPFPSVHIDVSPSSEDKRRALTTGGDSDELIQNCFGMASEQGFRALPFIESQRLRGQMTLALATLAIDWVGFICDDCEPSDRKTFKWAVAALENAQHVTSQGGIINISEADFILMRAKVASCVGLLISHFDILGARSSVAKAKEEEERLEREKAERARVLEAASQGEYSQAAAAVVEGSGPAGAPPMLGRADSGMQATEERWVSKVIEWEAARQTIEAEQRLIGRVLDDTRLEDRGLQFLASSSSRIQIRWQQGRFIGGGTFGTVYLAVNLDSGGLMAVKEIRFQDISSTPGMYKQIKDEMSVMEMLSHPNIVEYYGIEVHRDKVYIFEEYCQGGSLAQLLEHGRIEDEAVIQVYTLQMLDGLVYLHSKGVVHRDIKPDNILLDHMGVIKFVDFGAAKVLAKNSRTVQRSRRPGVAPGANMNGLVGPDGKPTGAAAASLQGTPMYMSPEVIKGESRGRRGAMDVWSLGCVVLEFATGRRPWSQLDNEWAIMFHIGMAQQHPPLPEPGQLSELGIEFIRSCLTIDPYERPSAIELREHPWIQSLIEELNQANEDESMLESGGVDSYNQSFVHGTDSAAGVAAMAATPGTRSISGFNFQRPQAPSFGGHSSLSHMSTDSLSSAALSTPITAPRANAPSPNIKAQVSIAEVDTPPHHEPGNPCHKHPGYQALVADLRYSEEERQKHEMAEPDEAD